MNRLYYLIATIPNFDPLDGKSTIDVPAVINTILNNTFDRNHTLIKMMLVSNDLRNLICYFSKNSPELTAPTLEKYPSILAPNDFEELHQKADAYPEFLKKLLQDEAQVFMQSTESEIKKKLWSAYWGALISSDNSFLTEVIKDYILFQNVVGLSRAKLNDDSDLSFWIGFEDLLEDLNNGRQTINGLIQAYPFLSTVPEKIHSLPEVSESLYDQLIIQNAEAQLDRDPFGIDHLLYIVLKLMILAKWQRRNAANGSLRFDFLEKQMKTNSIY